MPKVDDSDSDHVPIQTISPHPGPGRSEIFFEGSYDNVNFGASLDYSKPVKTEPMSTTTHSTLSSTTSQQSNGEFHCYLVLIAVPCKL